MAQLEARPVSAICKYSFILFLQQLKLSFVFVLNRIKREFGHKCCVVTFDSFYKGLSVEDHNNAENYNFDSPNALDFDLAYDKI